MPATSIASRRASLDELDAWVLEELEALSCRAGPEVAQPPRAQPGIQPAVRRREPTAAEVTPEPAPGVFDTAERAFIEGGLRWLAGRPNADIILEELWRLSAEQEAAAAEPSSEADDAGWNSAGPERRDVDTGRSDTPDCAG